MAACLGVLKYIWFARVREGDVHGLVLTCTRTME